MIDDTPTHARALQMASAMRSPRDPDIPLLKALPEGRLTDRFGRRITYLRLSLTDRCNLRCTYCVPVSTETYLPEPDLLTDDEIVTVLSVLARAGLEKVRFTGGEPLVRPGVIELLRRVRRIGGIRKLCVTTNGLLLESMGEELLASGVNHMNVSVDTLDPEKFRAVTRGGSLDKVWRGIEHVLALGTKTLKINAVLMKGLNEDEIDRFLDLTLQYPIEVRFIEFMPLAHCGEVHDSGYVPISIVEDALRRRGAAMVVPGGDSDGPASRFMLPGALAPVGVISPVSETSFCDRCNRVRLTADGQLKLCLFGDAYVDIRAALRSTRGVGAALESALIEAMNLKPEKMAGFSGFTMMGIGG